MPSPSSHSNPVQPESIPSTFNPTLLPLVLGVMLRRCSAAVKHEYADLLEPSACIGGFRPRAAIPNQSHPSRSV